MKAQPILIVNQFTIRVDEGAKKSLNKYKNMNAIENGTTKINMNMNNHFGYPLSAMCSCSLAKQ